MINSDHRNGSFFPLFISHCFLFMLLLLLSLSTTASSASSTALITSRHSQQCLDLLNLKKGFTKLNESNSYYYYYKYYYYYHYHTKTSIPHWLASIDCCDWEGVTCDETSRLIVSLDLSERFMAGQIADSLFNLTSLQRLNLAFNFFNQSAVLLSDLEKLANLTHLNLSYSGIYGQVPMAISRLTKLTSLDLSSYFSDSKLEKPHDLGTLIRDLSNLKELYLDGVNISSSDGGTEWCRAISDSVPGLEALSLVHCSLSGPIDISLSKLRNLSILHLDGNKFLSEVPRFFANFSSLRVLSLSSCGLEGLFPSSVFQLLNLKALDLSHNRMLAGSLPEFPLNSSLESLIISATNFSGRLPNSLGNLKSLTDLNLAGCHFSGPIPRSIGNLSELVKLDLYNNSLSGDLPPMLASSKISIIDLSDNNFTGGIPTTLGHARHLLSLDMGGNSLTGSIPMSLFRLPILEELLLADNKLSGQLQEFSNASSTLKYLDPANNNLHGEIPKSIHELSALEYLELGSNHLVAELELFGGLQNLTYLDLSGIDLLISDRIADSSLLFPSLTYLILESCNLTAIPSFLKHQKKMTQLDLSNNRINGIIPNWIWSIGNMNLSRNLFTEIERPFLRHSNEMLILDLSNNRIGGSIPLSYLANFSPIYLNLACNLFTSLEGSLSNLSNVVFIIDLHSNLLQGSIPLPPPTSAIVDYSNNLFTSIPFNISYYLNIIVFFSLSNNSLTGELPSTICSATNLNILDLSLNNLNGSIPACIFESLADLRVLNAQGNHFQGIMPQQISTTCALQTLNFHGNKLEGVVPSSLANCVELEVLDLGRNKLADSFPYWLVNLPALKVLVLKENNLFGSLTGICKGNYIFTMLQIFDISSNRFTGSLPSECFKSLKAMMVHQGPTETIGCRTDTFMTRYYQDRVIVTMKGVEIELTKILTAFTSIDLSNNRFVGNVPQVLGDLKSLHVLNMSLNAFTGEVPRVLGDMIELESLDLSGNQLSGMIPSSLTSLYFLEFLNLSNNNLVGRIPQGNQFNTFSNSSFDGNPGLCGSPLSRECISPTNLEPSSDSKNPPTEFDMEVIWIWLSRGLGYGVGFASVICYQLFFLKWKIWYKRRFMNR